MRNMAFAVIDRLFVVVYGTRIPTDDEWLGYLQEVERHGINRTMHLVYTEGGGPSVTQRRYLNEVLDGRTVPVAVLSDSAVVRGLVTALSWFNRKIRAFPLAEPDDALAYLEIPASRAELIERRMEKLRQSLGLPMDK